MGAVIGGGTAVYQCNVHGQGDCSGSYVATSAVVGAAAGAAGGLAGGAVLGLGAGEGESAIISGLVGGAASSSTGYVLNSALTSQNMSLGAVFHEAMLGSFSGAISGGISAGVGDVLPKNALNPLIGEMSGGFVSGFMGSYMNGNIGFSNALIGGLQGAGIAGASYGLSYEIGSFFAEAMAADGAYYDTDDEVMQERARWLKEYNPDEFSMLSHYSFDNESFGYDPDGLINSMSAYDMGTNLRAGGFNYQNEDILRFYSCDFGREGVGIDGKFRYSGARKLSTQLPSKIIVGPTRPLMVFPVYNKYGRLIYVGNYVVNGGQWAAYKAGRYLGSVNQAVY